MRGVIEEPILVWAKWREQKVKSTPPKKKHFEQLSFLRQRNMMTLAKMKPERGIWVKEEDTPAIGYTPNSSLFFVHWRG